MSRKRRLFIARSNGKVMKRAKTPATHPCFMMAQKCVYTRRRVFRRHNRMTYWPAKYCLLNIHINMYIHIDICWLYYTLIRESFIISLYHYIWIFGKLASHIIFVWFQSAHLSNKNWCYPNVIGGIKPLRVILPTVGNYVSVLFQYNRFYVSYCYLRYACFFNWETNNRNVSYGLHWPPAPL